MSQAVSVVRRRSAASHGICKSWEKIQYSETDVPHHQCRIWTRLFAFPLSVHDDLVEIKSWFDSLKIARMYPGPFAQTPFCSPLLSYLSRFHQVEVVAGTKQNRFKRYAEGTASNIRLSNVKMHVCAFKLRHCRKSHSRHAYNFRQTVVMFLDLSNKKRNCRTLKKRKHDCVISVHLCG